MRYALKKLTGSQRHKSYFYWSILQPNFPSNFVKILKNKLFFSEFTQMVLFAPQMEAFKINCIIYSRSFGNNKRASKEFYSRLYCPINRTVLLAKIILKRKKRMNRIRFLSKCSTILWTENICMKCQVRKKREKVRQDLRPFCILHNFVEEIYKEKKKQPASIFALDFKFFSVDCFVTAFHFTRTFFRKTFFYLLE